MNFLNRPNDNLYTSGTQNLPRDTKDRNAEIETYLRCTANPGGVGSQWVKKRYIEPHESNKSFEGCLGWCAQFP